MRTFADGVFVLECAGVRGVAAGHHCSQHQEGVKYGEGRWRVIFLFIPQFWNGARFLASPFDSSEKALIFHHSFSNVPL